MGCTVAGTTRQRSLDEQRNRAKRSWAGLASRSVEPRRELPEPLAHPICRIVVFAEPGPYVELAIGLGQRQQLDD